MLFYLGPRVALDTTLHPHPLPDNLDAHLEDSESKYPDITPGAEKTIVWADPQQRTRTEFAFVYLHGFSATRQESVPVPDDIATHFNSNIYYARLAGNGRGDDALAQGSVNKWVNDAAEALQIARRLGKRTIVIGCSTGATLAWWIAHQQPFKDDVSAMVFLSPNFGVADARADLLLYPWGAQLAKTTVGAYRESEPVSDLHAKYWTNRYPVEALLPMMGLVRLARQYPPQANSIPLHLTYSRNDDTVSVSQIKTFCQQLNSPHEVVEIVQPEGASQHVIAGNILAPENNDRITQSVIHFLESTLATGS
ncbi:MAG: alpha/beta hydrolase [Pseudomonadota bacterium]